MLAALLGVAAFLLQVIGSAQVWALHRLEVLIALGGIASWRWSWFVIQNIRALIYRYYTFPRLRRAAHQAIAEHGPVREVIILATTYHEKPWITSAVFNSIYREMATLQGLERRPRLIVVTGCDQDDQNIRAIHEQSLARKPAGDAALWPPELVLLRGDNGKRPALATGMTEIANGNPSPDGVVIILDGDTMLGPGLLEKVLPLFRLHPTVDAVTTNENGRVKGPAWFAEWTSLRFGLRHRSMCSISLSGKLLCLTGRFSVFRASVVTDPGFRSQVEHDLINHWLWGSFEMLSGDDKSTWYWLAANEKRMLYVPDAMVTTFEVITGSSLKRANANIRRWSGNSVRHSWRAMMLGPRKLSWFAWWSLLDQRLTMLTVLFGPTVALLGLFAGQYEMVAGYLLWVMCSRISHASIAWRQGRRFSAYYVPLQVVSDWATALTKLWVVFHPAKQNWMNRGARSLNTTTGSAFYGLRTSFAHYLYGFTCAALVAGIGLFVGFIPVLRQTSLFMNSSPAETSDRDASDRVNSSLHPEPWRLTTEPSFGPDSMRRGAVAVKPPAYRPWMAMKFPGKPADDKQPKQFEPASHE